MAFFGNEIKQGKATPQELKDLFYYPVSSKATDKELSVISSLLLNSYFNDFDDYCGLMYYLSSTAEKIKWLERAIVTEKFDFEWNGPLGQFKETDDLEQVGQWAKTFFETFFDTLSNYQLSDLLECLPPEERSYWTQKLIARNWLLSACNAPTPLDRGPLFSGHVKSNYEALIRRTRELFTPEPSLLVQQKIAHLQKIFKKLVLFTAQEYQKEKCVFFHGQNIQWGYLERWFNTLSKASYSKDFVRIRCTGKELSENKVRHLRARGVLSDADEDLVCPASLHPFALGCESNPLMQMLYNYDCCSRRCEYYLENIFKRHGFLEAYYSITQKDPTAFSKLYETYIYAIKNGQGGLGRLVGVSMPKAVVRKLTYTTYDKKFGRMDEEDKNSLRNTDATVAVEAWTQDKSYSPDQVCIILSKEFYDPAQAAKAGISFSHFDSIDETTPEFIEFKRQFDAVAQRIFSYQCPHL